MKNVVRFAVAGALMAGYATAQAQAPNQPSTNASDLWLFVSDSAAGTTFAVDTGQAISSILPNSSLAPGGSATVMSTAVSANFSVGPTAALTSYINTANAAGHTLQWAVEGMNFPGTTSAAGTGKPGGIVGIASEPTTQESNLSQNVLLNLRNWGNGFQGDMGFFIVPGAGAQPGYVAGGQTYKFSLGSAGGNVWGASTGGNGGSTDLYGQGPSQAGIGLGTSTGLYGITGNANNGGQNQTYVLGRNLTLSSTGTLTVSSVPLPAAVWLFGSGLLGLIGVGRRRAAVAV